MASFSNHGSRATLRAKRGPLQLNREVDVQFAVREMLAVEENLAGQTQSCANPEAFCCSLVPFSLQIQHHVAQAVGAGGPCIKGLRDAIQVFRGSLDKSSVRYLEDFNTCISFIKHSSTVELQKVFGRVNEVDVASRFAHEAAQPTKVAVGEHSSVEGVESEDVGQQCDSPEHDFEDRGLPIFSVPATMDGKMDVEHVAMFDPLQKCGKDDAKKSKIQFTSEKMRRPGHVARCAKTTRTNRPQAHFFRH